MAPIIRAVRAKKASNLGLQRGFSLSGTLQERLFTGSRVLNEVVLGTSVNKLPVSAPGPAGWHHAHGVALGRTRVGKEKSSCVSREEQDLGPQILRGDVEQGQRGRRGRVHGHQLPRARSPFWPAARSRGLKATERRLPVSLPRPERYPRRHLRRGRQVNDPLECSWHPPG